MGKPKVSVITATYNDKENLRRIMKPVSYTHLTAVIVALAIAFPTIRSWAAFQKRKNAAHRKAQTGKGGRQ